MITLLGPTASGKTGLAAHLAHQLDAEIISADSRQVYRDMNLGTGKDLQDYVVNNQHIPYHLIDICEAGEEYNVYRFVKDFEEASEKITRRGKRVILCGGTGMYLEAVLKGYNLVLVPENKALRQELDALTTDVLKEKLLSLGPVHATSDLGNRNRMVVAIEKRLFYRHNDIPVMREGVPSLVFGLSYPRDLQRKKITDRLTQRLQLGMIEEVEDLLEKGVSASQLISYGLEYKWITLFLTGKCKREVMFSSLNTAIHRFAKRQMTWFRRMEKNGIEIHWIDASLDMEQKLGQINTIMKY